MRLLICAGGTGGGVYPALAVLKALQDKVQLDALWIGGEGGIEVDLLSREDIPFTAIPAAGLHGVGLRSFPGNLWRIFKGFLSARRIIRDFHPQVIFSTGGYLVVPVVAASRLNLMQKRDPKVAVYVPDIEPGLALRFAARFSDQVFLTVRDSMDYFDEQLNLLVTGYPTRLSMVEVVREDDLDLFGLLSDIPTVLVFGGSKGARSINRAITACLHELLQDTQIIHITGQLDWPDIKGISKKLPPELRSRYHAYQYLHNEMGAALSAADLVVSRAGASILGEFPLYGLPAILVPYPHAWRYQEVNANYLETRGAALVLQDYDLEVHLLSTIRKLIHDHEMRNEMSQAMSSLATPQAAESIANALLGLVPVSNPGRM
ncbi:MAG: undecaprenyldiphospho-muramoylpentapeptide beta-N-acetylglucosaminyltransferase [Anaerolineales bacterium]|jgi:UDP-N-acetylglucosamine--N-acetylmuramyl-(pentapeptide) pyrophosphoryl-undecaprenol N-acetylglucosamine transferase